MSEQKDNRLKLIAGIPPSINNDYIKPRAIIKRGRPMAMMYETKVAKTYKKKIADMIKKEVVAQNFVREEKFTVVEWVFYFPRSNMDTNNYYKCFIDAVTDSDAIWNDDNISMMVDKNIYYDSKDPHIEVEIYYIDKIGIFKNQNELDLFVQNNCSKCKRGSKIGQKGGCSIYKKAVENRIQKEIDGEALVCSSIGQILKN